MKMNLLSKMLPVLVALFGLPPVDAAIITVNYSGAIASVTDEHLLLPAGRFQVGTSFNGMFRYDSAALGGGAVSGFVMDSNGRQTYKLSAFLGVSDWQLVIDGVTLSGNVGPYDLWVTNCDQDPCGTVPDSLATARYLSEDVPSFESIAGFIQELTFLYPIDGTGYPDLPDSSVLNTTTEVRGFLCAYGLSNSQACEARIDLDVTGFVVTPIPPALYLFGTGLIGLVGMARRKQLNRQII